MKKVSQKRIYLDHASGTPLDPRVYNSMHKIWQKCAGNPGAIHFEGRESKKILEDARTRIANVLDGKAQEIIFTSGATESNNLAIIGIYLALKEKYKTQGKIPHIITSIIEHKSILETMKYLEGEGVLVTYLKPNETGVISTDTLRKALKEDTMLVSLMYVNNEIGVINNIEEIVREVRHARRKNNMIIAGTPYFHTDAVQAPNLLPISLNKLNVDLLTLHSPKVYGPAGIGLLYRRIGTPLSPIMFGGGQEEGFRSGRELPLLAYGFSAALELSQMEQQKEFRRLKSLKEFFLKEIFKIFPDAKLNGKIKDVLPNFINIFIPSIDAEFAVIYLDEKGIAISSASTCMNNSADSYSYVIKEIQDENRALSSLRFTLGRSTTKKDLIYCLKVLEALKLNQCR